MANPQRGVVVSFVADDSKYKKGVRSASRHSKKFQKDAQGLKGTLKKLGPALNQVAKRGFQSMAVGLGASIREFANFQDALTESTAIMQVTQAEMLKMEEASLNVARTTTFSATESARAFFFLASAGLDAEQSIGALPQVSKFAQAGAFDLALATDLLTDAQSSLGLTSKDTAQNIENMARVSDVLVKANTLANASVQQFSESLTNKAGASLKVANKSIEEGVAVLSFFADQGVKGAEAGEKLNVVLRDIPRAGARNPQLFKDMGIEIFNAEGNLKNMADIVGEFTRVLGPMDDGLKATTLEQLGLTRSVGDAIKILLGGEQSIRAYEQALKSSGGTTEEVANKQLQSLKKQTQLAFNELRIAGQVLGKEFEPELRKSLEMIRDFSEFLQGDFLDAIRSSDATVNTINTAFDRFTNKVKEAEQSSYGFTEAMLDSENMVLRLSKVLTIFQINTALSSKEIDALGVSSRAFISTQIDFNNKLIDGNDRLEAGAKALDNYAGSGSATIPMVKEFLDQNNLSIDALSKLITTQNGTTASMENLEEVVKLVSGALFEEQVATNRLYRSQQFATNVSDSYIQSQQDAENQLKDNQQATEDLKRAEDRLGDTTRFLDGDILDLGKALGRTTRDMKIQESQARLLDKTYRSGLFKTASALTSAFDKFQQIQERGKNESERVEDATDQEREAFQELKSAEELLTQARENLTSAQMDGTETSIREQLEIQRLTDRVAELTDEFNKGKATALELQVAQLDLDEAIARAGETSSEYKNLINEVTRAEDEVARAKENHQDSIEQLTEAQEELQEATEDTFQSLVEEALAVDNLQSALDGFEGQAFIDTMQLIADKTGNTFASIQNMFNSLKLTFPGPGSIPSPSVDELPDALETSSPGSTAVDPRTPVKIYTTLQLDNEKFEQVTQKALIDLQRKGSTVVLN